jgi:hypothetical protein
MVTDDLAGCVLSQRCQYIAHMQEWRSIQLERSGILNAHVLAPAHAGIACFEGFLVNCLEACCQEETQPVDSSQATGGATHSCMSEATAPQQLPASAAHARQFGFQPVQPAARPALVAKAKRKHDSSFSAPRPVTVPVLTEQVGALQHDAAPCMQQPQSFHQRVQLPAPVLQQTQHRHLQHCSETGAADAAKRQRQRSGVVCCYLRRSTCMYACMHAQQNVHCCTSTGQLAACCRSLGATTCALTVQMRTSCRPLGLSLHLPGT